MQIRGCKKIIGLERLAPIAGGLIAVMVSFAVLNEGEEIFRNRLQRTVRTCRADAEHSADGSHDNCFSLPSTVAVTLRLESVTKHSLVTAMDRGSADACAVPAKRLWPAPLHAVLPPLIEGCDEPESHASGIHRGRGPPLS